MWLARMGRGGRRKSWLRTSSIPPGGRRARARSWGRLAQAANVVAVAGAAGAVIAALFGWIHTGIWFGGDSTMHWHRWTGTGLALAAPLAALLAFRADRRAFRIVIVLIAAALVAQGYWGAELAQGPDHLGLGI